VLVYQHDGEKDALKGKDGTDGEIDAAGDDDDAHPDAVDAEHPDLMCLIAEINGGEEAMVSVADDGADNQEENSNSKFFLHKNDPTDCRGLAALYV
jgi:hypothetical protein